jgi:hypothetical protein
MTKTYAYAGPANCTALHLQGNGALPCLESGTRIVDTLMNTSLICQVLPPGFGIICTHPMFGPESGKHGWGKLPFVFDKVRVADDGDQAATCDRFLSIFEQEVTLPELMISLI